MARDIFAFFERRPKETSTPPKPTYPEYSFGEFRELCDSPDTTEDEKRHRALAFLMNGCQQGFTPGLIPSSREKSLSLIDLFAREFDHARPVIDALFEHTEDRTTLTDQGIIGNLVKLRYPDGGWAQNPYLRIAQIVRIWGINDPALAELVCVRATDCAVSVLSFETFVAALEAAGRKPVPGELEYFRDGFLRSGTTEGVAKALTLQRQIAQQ